jgi:serine/threonine protein kinase
VTVVPSAPTLPPKIGRYRVVGRIGRGAMGVVYAAEDEQLGRRIAIKLMLGAFDEDPELRERFFREARITGQLAHRNIVTVFDLGEENGRPFIVMELLEGQPLGEFIRSEAGASLDTRIDLMMQVCDGLQSAHAAGVVHRDIKPNNLHVLRDGTLKLLDFGVARLASSNLTANGMLLGTPEYMSPEQARGQKMDARSDVFSATGVFYFMLTGRPPFPPGDLQKLLQAIISDEPAPLTDEQAPALLREALLRGLAKAPADRYQQCADMRDALEAVRRSLGAATSRIAQAARDRYQQVLAVVEERRALGRAMGLAEVEASCDEALTRIRSRFPAFASGNTAAEPTDRAVLNAALQALQVRHNAEQAALAALRERAAGGTGDGSGDRTRSGFWRGLLKPRGN